HVGFSHQLAVVDNASQQTCKHQPDRKLRIDTGTTIVATVAVSDLTEQPRQMKNAIDPHKNMVDRNELSQRSSDEQFQLISLLVPQHTAPPPITNHSR